MPLSDADVFVVDDDAFMRNSLQQLFKSVGLKVDTFSTANAFLESELPTKPGCLILDIQLLEMSGLELQDELTKREVSIPIIFITGQGTEAMKIEAMKAGAVGFLYKPFDDQELLDVVHHSIALKTDLK